MRRPRRKPSGPLLKASKGVVIFSAAGTEDNESGWSGAKLKGTLPKRTANQYTAFASPCTMTGTGGGAGRRPGEIAHALARPLPPRGGTGAHAGSKTSRMKLDNVTVRRRRFALPLCRRAAWLTTSTDCVPVIDDAIGSSRR